MEKTNLSRALYSMRSRTDTLGCHLEISQDHEYKRPQLPWPEKAETLHHLLRPLKTAYNWLESVLAEMPGVDLDVYRYIREIYNVESDAPVFWADEKRQGDQWFERQDAPPVLISGLLLRSWGSVYSLYSLDLLPLPVYSDIELIELPDTFDMSALKICCRAAKAYNQCVCELYDQGFFFFPAKFVDALASFYPAIPLPEGRLSLAL